MPPEPDMHNVRDLYARFCERYSHLASPEEADGRCRWACLAFADMAARSGIELGIIRWHVWEKSGSDTREYSEHWAVDLGQGRLLDPTSAQVEGLASPWARLADYPRNYMSPERVPARMLLPEYRNWLGTAGEGAPFSGAVMQRLDRAFNAHVSVSRTSPRWYVAGCVALVPLVWMYLHFLLTH